MRLYDLIQQTADTELDKIYYQGLIGNFARALQKAECFELAPTVVTACAAVSDTKPSSIIAATPILRLPYKSVWIEWYGDRGDYIRENTKIIPERMGCLITSYGPLNNNGVAYWAWHHGEEVTIAPFGIAFDWDMDNPSMVEQLVHRFNLPKHLIEAFGNRVGNRHMAQAVLVNTKKWYDQAKNEKEIDAFINLEKRAAIIPNHYAVDFIKRYDLLNPKNPGMINFTDDICGELPFIEAFLIMLNSKHILERTTDDFKKLNKARSKQRKVPLREFTTTKLHLTRTSENRARAAGMDRQSARQHLCRGHFKVRSSGVYWWSPHMRGSAAHVKRKVYEVT